MPRSSPAVDGEAGALSSEGKPELPDLNLSNRSPTSACAIPGRQDAGDGPKKHAGVGPAAHDAEDRQSRRHPQLHMTTPLLLVAASCLLAKRAVPSKRRHGFGCGRAGAQGTASQHVQHTPAPRPGAPGVAQLPYPHYAHVWPAHPASPTAASARSPRASSANEFLSISGGQSGSEVHEPDHPVHLSLWSLI